MTTNGSGSATGHIFREQLDLAEAKPDTQNRVLRGVVLIRSGMSKNRRYYGEDVLKEAAKIFEGTKAYTNHAQGSRNVRDLSGWYTGVRYENGALRADRHFSKNQAGQDVWAVAEEIVEGRAPASLIGLSISAVGSGKSRTFDDGEALNVESITAALSVDDVSDPAAGGGYKEDEAGDLTAALLKEISFEQWSESRPDYLDKARISWQTTRKSDELKAALDETERLRAELAALETFKAAKAETEQLQTAYQEAQTQVTALQAERDTAVLERDTARRELAVERAVVNAPLPTVWRESLRQQLAAKPETEWKPIIESEIAKAKAAGHRLAVHGADQQVYTPPPANIAEGRTTVPKEAMANFDEWLAWRNAQLRG